MFLPQIQSLGDEKWRRDSLKAILSHGIFPQQKQWEIYFLKFFYLFIRDLHCASGTSRNSP
jgi:hypothetical protein